MIKMRKALLCTEDLREDTDNIIREVKKNIEKIDYFKKILKESIKNNDIIKTKKIVDNMFWEHTDEEDFNIFLNLIRDKLDLFLHNFERAKGILSFSEIVEKTTWSKNK